MAPTMKLIFIVLFVSGFREILAMRPLDGDDILLKQHNLVIQSLPRGPVQSSGSNPCTYIPGTQNKGNRRCTLAADQAAPTAAFPQVMVHFGVASSKDHDIHQEKNISS